MDVNNRKYRRHQGNSQINNIFVDSITPACYYRLRGKGSGFQDQLYPVISYMAICSFGYSAFFDQAKFDTFVKSLAVVNRAS